jgi:cell shape-determining protein MreC
MNYLQDRRNKRNKISWIIGVLGILAILLIFKSQVFGALSRASHNVFGPVWFAGEKTSGLFGNLGLFFTSQKNLQTENQNLREEIAANAARLASYNSVLAENLRLREILGRKGESEQMVLGNILSKPGLSAYDTMVIDIGSNHGVIAGELVLAWGFAPIGRVAEVFAETAKVTLFSSPGQRTEVVLSDKNIFLEAVGRGGGNFEVELPRELDIPVGTEAMLPGTISGIVGTVAETISDPRDAFKKVLLVSPVNVQELKFVQVRR